MGLFDKISTPVDEIQVGSRVKPGAYEFQQSDVTYLEFDENHEKMPNQAAIIFELTVTDGDNPSEIGKKYTAFCRIPNEEEQTKEQFEMFASILKQNMLQFGIPESKLESWDPEDPDDVDAIIGLIGRGRIAVNKKNKDFDNLYNYTLIEESGASDSSIETNVGAWKN